MYFVFLIFADSGKGEVDKKQMIFGIATRIDLLNYVTNQQPENGVPSSP